MTPPPMTTTRARGGSWTTVALAAVPLGALVRVRPGGRIPLDGTITVGSSAVNQASVTGVDTTSAHGQAMTSSTSAL